MSERTRCILLDGKPIGIVTKHWVDKNTGWLNIGITIYNPAHWSGGIGTKALELWISEIFNMYPDLEHIGLVTWSGNIRMMKAALKLNMKEEARIRKVRYWNDFYYDSMSYGILRDEWLNAEDTIT